MTNSDNAAFEKLAKDLANARRTGKQIPSSATDILTSQADALAVQAAASKAYSQKTIGYKVGATNPAAQKMLGCTEPFYGPIFADDHYTNGSSLKLTPGLVGIEMEFAFQFGSDINPSDIIADRETLMDAVSACYCAIEVVGRRTEGSGLPGIFSAIADMGVNIAFIPGDEVSNWRDLDLSAIEVKGLVDDVETNSGTGGAVLGNPLNSLEWMVKKLTEIDAKLKAGDWISTGTCLGVIQPKQGTTVTGKFIGAGSVAMKLA